MNLLAALLYVSLILTPWYKDLQRETFQERSDRYSIIVSSTVKAAERATCTGQYANTICKPIYHGDSMELAFTMFGLAYMESRFARNVHAGKCEAHQCDAYKDRNGNVIHRAASIWQVHVSPIVPRSEWEQLGGLDQVSTDKAAWAATRVYVHGRNRCGTMVGGISQYAGTGRCDWPEASKRAALIEHLMRKAKEGEKINYQLDEKYKRGKDEPMVVTKPTADPNVS